MAYYLDLTCIDFAFFASAGRVPSMRELIVLQRNSEASMNNLKGYAERDLTFKLISKIRVSSIGQDEDSETIWHFTCVTLLLCKHSIDVIVRGWDLPTMKFIQAHPECSLSPTDTNSDICPSGQTSEALPPSRYIRHIREAVVLHVGGYRDGSGGKASVAGDVVVAATIGGCEDDGAAVVDGGVEIVTSWNRPSFYDDDDDEYSIQVSEFLKKSPIAIAPILPTEEPDNSLNMSDEHLSTISKTKSDEVIKSSVENLVLIPSEFEGISNNICDVPFSEKNHSDAESDLIESLLTPDTLVVYSPESDSLLEEFAGELVHIDPIPPGINETDSDPKDDISFINLEEVKDEILQTSSGSTTTHADNSLLGYDSFLFEIEPDQGELTSVVMNDIFDNLINDPLMEEIDLILASDNLIPPGIKNVDYDSEGDIFFLEELIRNNSLPLPEFNHFILIFMMIHHLLILQKNHQMMVAF
uniref:Uncharacterized protein n=1 Tax=Tanacetum cinerariifolium TaxID=118510 RepID=A0A699GKL1_TANCI|nr:hypothetical protein [Tanacetum cinerariifolium]